MMKPTLPILALSLFALIAQARATEVIVDGDFESPDTSAWIPNYSGMIGNWNAPGTSGHSLYLGLGGTAGSDAMQVIDLSAYRTATLSFDVTAVARNAPNTSIFAVSAGYDNEVYRYYFEGSPVGQLFQKHISIPLTAAAAFKPFTALVFSGMHGNDSSTDIWVDNVSIQAQAVPEPATIGALALGAFAALRRRRK